MHTECIYNVQCMYSIHNEPIIIPGSEASTVSWTIFFSQKSLYYGRGDSQINQKVQCNVANAQMKLFILSKQKELSE